MGRANAQNLLVQRQNEREKRVWVEEGCDVALGEGFRWRLQPGGRGLGRLRASELGEQEPRLPRAKAGWGGAMMNNFILESK